VRLTTAILCMSLLGGCAVIPVKEATVHNDKGGSITCKQVGRGVASYWVGKSVYDHCLAQASAQGYQ
jgi:hypothetical protein